MATEWTIDALKAEMSRSCKIISPQVTGGVHAQVYPHATRLACMFFKFPDNQTAQGQPPDTVRKFNELVNTLRDHQFNIILKAAWLPFSNSETLIGNINHANPPVISGGLWCHENKLNELTERMDALERTNQDLKKQSIDSKRTEERSREHWCIEMEERIDVLEQTNQALETSVTFLKARNTVLEKHCIIDNSKYAFLIQRYWKKYVLIKRIREAAKIYRLTRNFSRFINPVEMIADLIDCRSVVSEGSVPTKPPTTTTTAAVGRRHTGPASEASACDIRRSNQIVQDWMN